MVFAIATYVAVSQLKSSRASPSDMQIKFVTQYMVGAKGLSPSQVAPYKSMLMGDIDKEARTPDDQFRAAMAAGELIDTDEALKRMDTLAGVAPELAQDAGVARAIYAHEPVDDARWSAFHDKYGWFAELAQSNGKPDADPQRAGVLNSGYRVVITTVVALMAIALLGFVGLGLLILGIVLWSKGRIRMAFSPAQIPGTTAPLADRRLYVQGFAIYLFCMMTFGYGMRFIFGKSPITLWMEVIPLTIAFALGIGWPLFFGQGVAEWRATFGFHRGRGFFREVGSGLVGYLAGLPIVAIGFFATAILIKITGINASHPINQVLGGSWLDVLAAFVLAAILAPIMEESMFRGALFAHLREHFGWWISAPTVGVIFAIIHPQGWVALPVLGSIGFVFCGIREWRGSIIPSMAAHAFHNTIALLVALALFR
jgi:membrane protease YdiL (CAAX protease family)